MEATPTVTIYFSMGEVTPDPRPFKPGMPRLYPEYNGLPILVAVEIPLTKEYIYNAEQLLIAQIANDNHKPPILTPAGMKYAIRILEDAMGHDVLIDAGPDDDDWSGDNDKFVEFNLNN